MSGFDKRLVHSRHWRCVGRLAQASTTKNMHSVGIDCQCTKKKPRSTGWKEKEEIKVKVNAGESERDSQCMNTANFKKKQQIGYLNWISDAWTASLYNESERVTAAIYERCLTKRKRWRRTSPRRSIIPEAESGKKSFLILKWELKSHFCLQQVIPRARLRHRICFSNVETKL